MGTIRNALEAIRTHANEYLQNLDKRADDWVVLANIADHKGHINDRTNGKIVMSVYNITHETIVSTYVAAQPGTSGGYAVVLPPLYIDLHLMFMANFVEQNYAEGLTAIS